jgi:hypothetical protein
MQTIDGSSKIDERRNHPGYLTLSLEVVNNDAFTSGRRGVR